MNDLDPWRTADEIRFVRALTTHTRAGQCDLPSRLHLLEDYLRLLPLRRWDAGVDPARIRKVVEREIEDIRTERRRQRRAKIA